MIVNIIIDGYSGNVSKISSLFISPCLYGMYVLNICYLLFILVYEDMINLMKPRVYYKRLAIRFVVKKN